MNNAGVVSSCFHDARYSNCNEFCYRSIFQFSMDFFGSAIFFAHRRAQVQTCHAKGGPVGSSRVLRSVQAFPINHGPVGGDLLEAAAQVIKVWTCGKIMEDLLWKSHELSKMFHKFPRNEGWNMTKYDDICSWHICIFPDFPLKPFWDDLQKIACGIG